MASDMLLAELQVFHSRPIAPTRRLAQPRLRHRFQEDRIGLTRSSHRLFRNDQGMLRANFNAEKGAPAQHVLGAIYAAQEFPANLRGPVLSAVRRGLEWSGDIGPGLLAHLSGRSARSLHADAVADPIGWARGVLGISSLEQRPEKVRIRRQFREALLDAHPDRGGNDGDAAQRIADLSEARQILLSSEPICLMNPSAL